MQKWRFLILKKVNGGFDVGIETVDKLVVIRRLALPHSLTQFFCCFLRN